MRTLIKGLVFCIVLQLAVQFVGSAVTGIFGISPEYSDFYLLYAVLEGYFAYQVIHWSIRKPKETRWALLVIRILVLLTAAVSIGYAIYRMYYA